MTLETLKYRNGKFTLEEVSTPKLRLKLAKNANWKSLGNDAYETVDLATAAAYRQFSDEKTKAIFKRTFQERYKLASLPPLLDLKNLDPHQWEGIKWILTRKRSYLAHAPGAGKTAEAIIASSLSEGRGQTLFIVPPFLTVNWLREVERFTQWTGDYREIAIVPRSDHQEEMNWDAGYIICPDSMLAKPWVYTALLKMQKKFIAVDEASRFKDHQAERSLAFYGGTHAKKSFPGLFKNVRHVVFLDGSPMPNRSMELWAPCFALDPESIECMDRDSFGYRYCGAKPNDRGVWEYLHSSNEKELQSKLQKQFMHVVTEEKLEHPERRRSMLYMDGDVRTGAQKTWEQKHLNKNEFSEADSQGELAKYRRELGLRKVPWIASYVRQRLEEKNESILLFAWHRDVCEGLTKELYDFKPGLVIGGVTADWREHLFQKFQAGKLKLLIMNIAAGGRGHNLQRADRVIFGEWAWTDETNKQCEKRASRRGNDKSFVRCEYIVAPNSLDERVLNSVFTKERRVKKVIG